MKFFRAVMEGPTFTFEAFGETKAKAERLLIAAMTKHAKEYDLPRYWYADMDRSVVEVKLGSAYRDGEEIL